MLLLLWISVLPTVCLVPIWVHTAMWTSNVVAMVIGRRKGPGKCCFMASDKDPWKYPFLSPIFPPPHQFLFLNFSRMTAPSESCAVCQRGAFVS